jgi:cation:H+ antiporter
MQFVFLILGLAMIIKSADVLIDSSAEIARRYGVSSFIIGITVIAFGTSAPELAVGIVSGINHINQLTLGNIIGSSMSNIGLIVGLAAVILPLQVRGSVVKRELPLLFVIQIILGAMLFMDGQLSRAEGFVLLGAFVLFMIYISGDAGKSAKMQMDAGSGIDTGSDGNRLSSQPENGQKNNGLTKLWCYSLLALFGLFIGGKLTVDSSTRIAQSFGLSETLIGLTVVALATTMPELITSIVAARKKEPEIVLGNCIGSNIFNILLVLGLSSVISPIPADSGLWIDVAAMLVLTLFVFSMSLLHKKLRRLTGIFLLTGYAAYLAYKVIAATV